MLDYAQLSAGQFRRFKSNFNLIESINEMIEVMNYKAYELGINMFAEYQVHNINSEFFKKDAPQPTEWIINFDK